MNQSQFIRKVASEMDVSIPEAKLWVSTVFDALTEEIMSQDKVIIMNFGTFRRKIRAPLKRGDVKNKDKTIIIPQKTVVSFETSPFLENIAAEEYPLEN